jgi:hypothetical protein
MRRGTMTLPMIVLISSRDGECLDAVALFVCMGFWREGCFTSFPNEKNAPRLHSKGVYLAAMSPDRPLVLVKPQLG